jgi:16S rRNA (cytosine967-C5)-methyltransferase
VKFDNQLRYATTIITAYQGETPLHAWLKDFFRQHKQMGSRDRKTVSSLVYGFYRLGHSARELPIDQHILLGQFLTASQPGELLEYFHPEWNQQASRPLEEKIELLRQQVPGFDPADIFPWKNELSEGIDHYTFCLSFLRQPDLFLRIRPGYQQQVLQRLSRPSDPVASAAILTHEFIPPNTIRLPNGTKVEELFTPDKEVVIQDYSSQRIAGLIPPARTLWDACAASGGKSILAHDLMPGIEITVSDIRESILQNLHRRFRQAGIDSYHSFVMDLTRHRPSELPFDLVLADVPCTGSGTWSRTPEELYFFNPQKILHYQTTQKSIIGNIIPGLSHGTQLVYSTCSVFKKENEEMIAFIRDRSGMQQDQAGIIKGYDQRADTMFAARLIMVQ